ncbi:MAG: ParB/RepB/Spo0J family partition protein [Oscillospiraceae bacterium]
MSILTKQKQVNRVLELHIGFIKPNPHQPRRFFDTNELTQLAKSIAQDGILQPLTVRQTGDKYELVSGERRLRAAKLAGLRTVPCIVMEMTERNSALLALIENLQREDLTFFEEAEAIDNLIKIFGMTQEDVAIRLGMAQSTVANKLRLLRLTEEERQVISGLCLTERHARALLKLGTPELRIEVLEKIAQFGLNVEKTEAYIQKVLEKEKLKSSYKKRAVVLKDVRLFMNTINKAVEIMKLAGVAANARKTQTQGFIEYVITIPVEGAEHQTELTES